MKFSLSHVSIALGAVLIAGLLVTQTIFAGTTVTSSVVVGAATPQVSAVTVNGGSAITLTANATTSVNVNATVTHNNGCTSITGGTSTILLYRNAITSSTCLTTQNNRNCYLLSAFTASSTCTATSVVTTSTFGVYYFADATDASSSFSGQGWRATVIFKDSANATGTADSATTTLNSLAGLNVTTSSINYGTLSPAVNTGSTNQTTIVANAGNSTTTLNLSGTALASGSSSIATSSQHYATSSFTFGGAEQALSGSATAVTGFSLTAPTSTTNVVSTIYWGITVPGGTATGTYSGTNTYTAAFSP